MIINDEVLETVKKRITNIFKEFDLNNREILIVIDDLKNFEMFLAIVTITKREEG